jgi:RNA polymerase sigma-70 factor (ECF subfamily)
MTEAEVLERFVTENDPDAFRVLVDRHGPMVLGVCRSIVRAQHDAEDAFQNTFLALARYAGKIKQRESIAPWLHRVAVRTAQRARRRLYRDRAMERIRPDSEPQCRFRPRDLSFVPLLREEVNRLPDGFRQPVELCYLDGKSNEEVAAELGCPVGTVKGRLWRARQTLRNRLTRRGLNLYVETFSAASQG